MESTTITVSIENYQWLSGMKRPGESFNDVLNRIRQSNIEPTTTVVGTEANQNELPNDLDLPGSADVLEKRRATIAQLYAYIQSEGTARKSDLLELVDPTTVGYSSKESFWSNCIKGRDTLRVLPGIQPPAEGEHTWRYTGE